MSKKLRVIVVVVFATVLTTVGIGASDVAQEISGGLFGSVIKSTDSACPENTTMLLFGDSAICMDTFEASPAQICAVTNTSNELDTRQNLTQTGCSPVSQNSRLPWRFVNFSEAQQLCARAGKRLPTNYEWYKAVSGINQLNTCAIDGKEKAILTGVSGCVSPAGIEDMIGNVWEWVEADIKEGQYDGRSLPESGYVDAVDTNGVVLETNEKANIDYGNDYAWTNQSGVRGMLRGGFYASGDDAGIFSINASVPLDFRTAGIGFRCVKDIR